MKKPIVIAVAGPKGAGKTSLCRLLSAVYARALGKTCASDPHLGKWCLSGFHQDPDQAHRSVTLLSESGEAVAITIDSSLARIVSFAGPLKKMAEHVLGVDPSVIYGDDSKKSSPTQFLWDKQSVWIRWINSKNRSLTYHSSSEVLSLEKKIVNDIKTEYELWKFCTLYNCFPTDMRSGPMSGREVLQIIGTDIFRNNFDNKVWVKALERDIHSHPSSLILIDDVRFDDELDAVSSLGGAVIRFEGYKKNEHESELGISDIQLQKCQSHISVAFGDRSKAAALGVEMLKELYQCRQSMKSKAVLSQINIVH